VSGGGVERFQAPVIKDEQIGAGRLRRKRTRVQLAREIRRSAWSRRPTGGRLRSCGDHVLILGADGVCSEAGQFIVDCVSFVGSGTFTAWDVLFSVAPDLTHEGRTDNPYPSARDRLVEFGGGDKCVALRLALRSSDAG
jgi:hypothetical protein